MIPQPPSFILASASPRRAELLRTAGYRFRVLPSPVEEPRRRPRDIPLELWPTALAFIKAYGVAQSHPRATVLGADTIVLLDGKVLGKPRHRADARAMLQRLSGRRHEVITGLALIRGGGAAGDGHSYQVRLSRAVSICRIRKLRPAWLEAYLDTGLWRGKAGSYGIQDHNDPWVQLLRGEFSNVVGLPLELLAHELHILLEAAT
jgi:septum formation protein